jgi:hypothetical protein
MVRLGGAYYGNPYVDESSDVVKVSGGVGYRNRGFFMDLTYVYSMAKLFTILTGCRIKQMCLHF